MTCRHCGAPLADGAKFCENCGNKIETETQETFVEPERVEAEVVEEAPKANFSSAEESSYSNEEERVSSSTSSDPEKGPIGYSIASLVCGILGLLCCCCGFFGLVLSAAGIILGIVSISKNCEGKGLAIAGIACGGVSAFFIVIGMIAGAATGNFGLDDLGNIDDMSDQITDFLESL